jgi:hypothetical protein
MRPRLANNDPHNHTRFVRFYLPLPTNSESRYRVALTDDGDDELWNRELTPVFDGKAVVLTVPVADLSEGEYSFKLNGITTPDSDRQDKTRGNKR